jgi:hypothetical protein
MEGDFEESLPGAARPLRRGLRENTPLQVCNLECGGACDPFSLPHWNILNGVRARNVKTFVGPVRPIVPQKPKIRHPRMRAPRRQYRLHRLSRSA